MPSPARTGAGRRKSELSLLSNRSNFEEFDDGHRRHTGDDKGQRGAVAAGQDRFAVSRWWPGSTTRATSGCSTNPGASTSRCRHRACWPRWSRGVDRRPRAHHGVPQGCVTWWRSRCPTTPPGVGALSASSNCPGTQVTIPRGNRVIVPSPTEASRAAMNCCSSPRRSRTNCGRSCCRRSLVGRRRARRCADLI